MEKSVDILIVEDNPTDAELFIRSIGDSKKIHQIKHLEDGALALDFLFCRGQYADRKTQLPPKVIFLDLKLPKVSGLEVLRQIKENDSTRKIPVVIVSSSAEEPDIAKSYKDGANSYVVKPVDYSDYESTIGVLGKYWIQINEEAR